MTFLKKLGQSSATQLLTPYYGWLGLSLTVALFYGWQSWHFAISRDFFIQDDARQHIFWMQRFINPALFANDLIADYFQSVAPPGFTAFYHLFAKAGVDPLWLSKLLPAVLGILTTLYCFGVSLRLFPVPAAAFLSTLLLNQALWMEDDLASATPRAFLYPLLLAFLYYLLRGWQWAALAALALLGLFYPQMALLAIALLTLRLFRWPLPPLRLKKASADYQLWGAALLVLALILLPYKLGSTEFGPLITVAQAKALATFNYVDGYYGRSFFFSSNPLIFWLLGPRSGLLFWGILSPLCLSGLALPFLLKQPQKFPSVKQVSAEIKLLAQLVLASLILFGLAHLLLFQLHFPNRYVYHSFRIVLAIAAGISLYIYFAAFLKALPRWSLRQKGAIALPLSLVVLLLVAPFLPQLTLANQLFKPAREPALHQFLRQQPIASLVVSLDKEAENIPTFSQRSTLVAREYAFPYHWGYYTQFRQRVLALTAAQYSNQPEQISQFIQQFAADFWLLDKQSFTSEYVIKNRLLREFQATEMVLQALENPETLVLPKLIERCTVLDMNSRVLLAASCVDQAAHVAIEQSN
ncbi:hypothetical protein [Almyronema epifaneia]|uniref:Glycosyltransferase RgtA/B/C/D-like domain-containing protein n=1 Tax=Almyronema epifaneia S1 TaxID=2991925 RepID=A0ABW6IL31_9CYAN